MDEPSVFSDDIVELNDIDFDRNLVWAELVFFASVLLKAHSNVFHEATSIEARNDAALRFLSFFCDENRKSSVIRAYITGGSYWASELLPDVCGACHHAFGLTIGGRYRLSCFLCKGKRTHLAFEISMDIHRLCPSNVGELVLEQLIYKYYSTNGDKTWEMKKTTTLLA